MEPFLKEHFGNPSSSHAFGLRTRAAVENARKQVAALLNCRPHEVIFTSGGTESNNLSIKGTALAGKEKGRHIITTSIEHPAVIEVCRYLEGQGFEVSYLPVNDVGVVNPGEVEARIRPDTILISVMHANNETGSIQPIAEIAGIARKHGIVLHTDAAQTAGKLGTDVRELGADLVSLAAHKFYGPKGIGALFIRDGITLEKLVHGADHEFNIRAGTENVAQIVGMGMACEVAQRDLERNAAHMKMMRDLLFDLLSGSIPGSVRNGDPDRCLPNTLSISFPEIDAGLLVPSLDNVAVSTGAACHAGVTGSSHVLEAMGLSTELIRGTIRCSTGKQTTEKEIREAANALTSRVRELTGGDIRKDPGQPRLTMYTHGLGCGCKLPAADLEGILSRIDTGKVPGVMVNAKHLDDAAVYRISKQKVLVQSVDFFTPMVDDPWHFGAISAANALSDIYAMGAEPAFALNIVAFPVKILSREILHSILEGAADVASVAGVSILGGHSIENPEPVFGMVVNGFASAGEIITNAGARPGDALILTKPVGTGIITTAIKSGQAGTDVTDRAVRCMEELNREASRLLHDFPVSACTDVTGFGLLGHLLEMVKASRNSARIISDKVPVLEGTEELVMARMVPGGTTANMSYCEPYIRWDEAVSRPKRIILNDAQTSGGLLIAVRKEEAESMLRELHGAGVAGSSLIGEIGKESSGRIHVV